MAQSGGRYERDDRESGWRRDRDYESERRFGRGSQYTGDDDGYQGRSEWQDRPMESQGGEWNRMGRYGDEDRGNYGGWENDGMRRTASSRGTYASEGEYRGSGNYSSGDFRRPTYGDTGNWPMRSNPYGYGYGGAGYGEFANYGSQRYGSRHNERGFMEKAGDEVASWFGDEDARRRREHDEHRGRGPKGYARSDERIKEDVSDRLSDDGALDASDIEVQVSDREVTLSGEVNGRNDKRRAEDLAEMVSGVQHVQNNLRVKNRGSSGNATLVAGSGANQGPTAAGTSSGIQTGKPNKT